MFEISKSLQKKFLIGINCFFIAMGLSIVGYGLYQHETTLAEVAAESDANEGMHVSGWSNIVSGSVDTAIGIFGFVCAIQRKRTILYVYIGVVGASLLFNFTLMIMFGISGNKTINDMKVEYRKEIKLRYGKNYEKNSREYTRAIDEYQDSAGCCGFTGLDGENLFAETFWYQEINMNSSTGQQRTLPESCCQKTSIECTYATNVKEARDKGFVNKFDCMERMTQSILFLMVTSILCLIVIVLAQASAIAFCSLAIYQGDIAG